jgi:hypothetical protein
MCAIGGKVLRKRRLINIKATDLLLTLNAHRENDRRGFSRHRLIDDPPTQRRDETCLRP